MVHHTCTTDKTREGGRSSGDEVYQRAVTALNCQGIYSSSLKQVHFLLEKVMACVR